jgi:hypothetical protein
MTKTKKVVIWSLVGVGTITVVALIVKASKKASVTVTLPIRNQVAGTAAVKNNTANSIIGAVKGLVSSTPLPLGFKRDSKNNITTADGTIVKTYDPNTGAYQETDGTWYLNNGTVLLAYDSTNGAYQESDGTWYTFDGTALASYDPNTGAYKEQGDDTVYDREGNPINLQ